MSTGLDVYQRVVIRGKSVGAEIWQTGFWTVCTTNPATQPDLQAVAAAIEPFVNTWWTAVKVSSTALMSYLGITMYQFQAPSTKAEFSAEVDRSAVPGTLATGTSPIDTCCVVSIRSATPGRTGRNRMYVPCVSACNATTGMWDATVGDTIGTATKALFSAVVSGSIAAPVVLSRTRSAWDPPTALDTDSKPDVQRRRENRLLANHTQVLAFP